VIPSVGPLRGRPSEVVRQLTGSLSRAGVETHIATTDDNGPGTLKVMHGRPVVHSGVAYWYFPRQLRFYTVSWPLAKWLEQHVTDYDVVHIHALFSFSSVVAAYWAHRRGVPYVVRPLGTLDTRGVANRQLWLKKISFELLERRILERASMVHYTSEQERREAEALKLDAPSAVIPIALPGGATVNGSAVPAGAFLNRHPQLEGRRIVLFLSRLDRKKGLDVLLRAFADVSRTHPDAALVIAGAGDRQFTDAMREEARKLGIARDTLWVGFLTGRHKEAALADADLYVLPSHSRNFGIAAAEAMAAGLPVIVSDQVGIHSDIADANAGLVVRCAAAELARAIRTLLDDDDRRRQLGMHGRRLAAERFSQEGVTGHVLDVYNRIAS